MTYEEYKESKNPKKSSFIRNILSKLFTIIIFSLFVIILSNLNSSFRKFLIDDVLNSSMNFSKVNGIVSYIENIFKEEKTENVFKDESISYEKYKDGIKYFVNKDDSILLKNSGIVTYIGEKEGYNNTIIIQQSDGNYAWYGNIKESIKLYDYIEKGEEIGKSNGEYYYYVLYKDEVPITYED